MECVGQRRVGGVPHRHITGVIVGSFTYARGEGLSDEQFAARAEVRRSRSRTFRRRSMR
jgi:hypothetical protein